MPNLCETQAEKAIKSTSTNLWHCINFSDPKVPKLWCITQRLVLLHLCFAVSLFQVGVCSETLPRAATAATVTVGTAATQPPGCNVEFGPLALRRAWKVDTRCRNSNASWPFGLGRSVAASHCRLLKTKGHHLGPWKKCEMFSFHGSWMGNLEKLFPISRQKKPGFFNVQWTQRDASLTPKPRQRAQSLDCTKSKAKVNSQITTLCRQP